MLELGANLRQPFRSGKIGFDLSQIQTILKWYDISHADMDQTIELTIDAACGTEEPKTNLLN